MIVNIILFCILCLLVFGKFRMIIHEYAHAIAAKIVGEKVIKVHLFWFKCSYVEFENEPASEEEAKNAPKHMAAIAFAGFLVTNVIGYFMCFLYYYCRYNIDNIFVILLTFIAMSVFLFSDSAYFAIGSVIGKGDVTGFRACLHMPKWLSMLFFIPYFLLNCSVILYIYISTLA
jgi:hypothetical protein